jgi:hypothetical protein
LQPPSAHLLNHGLEAGEEHRRVGNVQRRASADREQPHLDQLGQPAARITALRFARPHIVTDGTASSVEAIRWSLPR